MTDDNTFLTKTGICQVTDNEIFITRETVAGALASALLGKTVARTLGMYLVVGILLFANGIFFIGDGNFLVGGTFLVTSVLLVRGVIKNRTISATKRILFTEITHIEPHPPLPGFRGFFVIYFLRNGKERQRMVILPGAARDGKAEYEKAKIIMARIPC